MILSQGAETALCEEIVWWVYVHHGETDGFWEDGSKPFLVLFKKLVENVRREKNS